VRDADLNRRVASVLMYRMSTTRTGRFPIGFRRGRGEWQKDMPASAMWARENGFALMDLSTYTPADGAVLKAAGLALGSIDLLDFSKLTALDEGLRKDVIARNVAYIKSSAAAGARLFFTIVPGESSRTRTENYRLAVESFAPLAEAAAGVDAKIVIEGYPGGAPNYALLCCTPDTVRAFLKDLNSPGLGLNYDPSHLVRLSVDPVRFLKEFLPHVHHVHGKDTAVDAEAVYEYGLYQGSPFAQDHAFGQLVWRYTIPGHGQVPWTDVFAILAAGGYKGAVSIELEDEHFNGSEAGEKAGLLHGLNFLRGA
jgi:sugar phosphate isomerase/epimerase